jgi:hypothetical protein
MLTTAILLVKRNYIYAIIDLCDINNLKFPLSVINDLKGQSHEKVGEMRVQGDSLGPN